MGIFDTRALRRIPPRTLRPGGERSVAVARDGIAPMSAGLDSMVGLTYRYLQQFLRTGANGAVDEWSAPSVRAGADAEPTILDRLFDAERYPGEAFDATVEPDPRRIVRAFTSDVGIEETDVVGVSAPSSQLFDELFYALFDSLGRSGAVLTTKYPASDVRRRLSETDPVVLDCTPGAETDGGVDASSGVAEPLRCGDLTSIGVAAQRATNRVATADEAGTFAISTVTQLRSHHDAGSLDRFLHELVGQWRNLGLGGLVHVPPADPDGDGQCFGSAHFDYVVEIASERQAVVARVRGKRDVEPTWRAVGTPTAISESTSNRRRAADGNR